MEEQVNTPRLNFDLQLFAGEGGDGGAGEGNPDAGGEGNPSGGKAATDGDKSGAMQDGEKSKNLKTPEEVDTAVKAAIAEAKAAWETEYKQKAERERKEAERLSKLSAEQRQKEELETLKKELAAKESELRQRELREEMTKVLEERGIPLAFMDYFITDSSKTTLKRITDFEKAYKKAVADGVDAKLKSTVPPGGGGGSAGNAGKNASRNGFLDIIRKNQAKR